MPGFDDLSMLTVQLGDKTDRIASCQNEQEFVACLRRSFGSASVPNGKAIFLSGKDSTGKPFSIKLSAALKASLSSEDPCNLEFVDDEVENWQGAIGQGSGEKHIRAEPQQEEQMLSIHDRRRALQVKRGRSQNQAVDAAGKPVSTKGKNVHSQLTTLQTAEMHKIVHLSWKKNAKSGCPYNLSKQDPAVVKGSILEMQANPVLRGRPSQVLKRKAAEYVTYLNREYDEENPYKEGLIWLEVKKKMQRDAEGAKAGDVEGLYAEAGKELREGPTNQVKEGTRGRKRKHTAADAGKDVIRSPGRKRVTAKRGSKDKDELESGAREEEEAELEGPPLSEDEWETGPDSDPESGEAEPWKEEGGASSEEEEAAQPGGVEEEGEVWNGFLASLHEKQPCREETELTAASNAATNLRKNDSKRNAGKSQDGLKPVLQVSLWNWCPIVEMEKSSGEPEVKVCGQFSVPADDDVSMPATKEWKSCAIVGRESARKVRASDGKTIGTIQLLGKVDIDSMLKEGFSEETVESFNGGFPEDWLEMLEEESVRIEEQRAKGAGGRGKREKKPSTKLTEAAEAAKEAAARKERPSRKPTAKEEITQRRRKATAKLDQDAAAALLALDTDDMDSEQDVDIEG